MAQQCQRCGKKNAYEVEEEGHRFLRCPDCKWHNRDMLKP